MRSKCVLCDVTEKVIDFVKLKMTLIAKKKKNTFEMFVIVRPRISVYIFMGSLKMNTTISRIYVVWKMVVLVILYLISVANKHESE